MSVVIDLGVATYEKREGYVPVIIISEDCASENKFIFECTQSFENEQTCSEFLEFLKDIIELKVLGVERWTNY